MGGTYVFCNTLATTINNTQGNHRNLLYGKLMRGVTSSSATIADWMRPADSSAAARRQWTVVANVHMVALSGRTDIHKHTLVQDSLAFIKLLFNPQCLFSHSHLPAGRGGVKVPLTDSCTPSGPYTLLVDS